MAVMHVRIVRMRMRHRSMTMVMGVRLGSIPFEIMLVLMMGVVAVAMVVLQRFMRVLVRMAFADMQPHAERHQSTRDPEHRRRRLTQQQQ